MPPVSPTLAVPPLVEREGEVATLTAALEDAMAGRGRTVAIVGDPGIGKSCLLAEARERANATGMLVCSARGAELERPFPFGIVRQLAASSYRDTTAEERASWYVGVAARAAPLFREDLEEASDPTYARLHALYWLCANASRRRPLVLVVDDAHWADDASLAFVGFLARRVAELPLLLLLGTRPPAPSANAELVRLLADPDTTTFSPDPLSGTGVATVLQGALDREPEREFAAACHAATAGNPFLVGELAEEVRAEAIEPVAAEAARVAALIPPGVKTMTLLRLARLSDPAQRLARAVALLGDRAPLAVAAELAQLDEAATIDAAVELVEAGIVTRADGLGFVHPLLRTAISDDIPSVERLGGHARAAAILTRHRAPVDVVALQLLRIDPCADQHVVATMRAAARRALSFGDSDAAVAYLRRALAEPPPDGERTEILLELGLARARADGPAGVPCLRQAVAAAADPELRSRAALRLGELLNLLGRAEAPTVLEQALADCDSGEWADALRAELIASAYVRTSTRERLAPLVESLREPDGVPGTPLELVTTIALAVEHAVARGEPDHGAALARQALLSPAAPGGVIAAGHLQVPLMVALIVAERRDEAEAAVTASLQRAREMGSPLGVAVASGHRALVRLRAEDLLGAEADALACLELRADAPGAEPVAMAAAATAVLAGLQLGRAPADLERLIEDHRGDPDFHSHTFLLIAEGLLRLFSGDPERALSCFERCGEYRWAGDCVTMLPWRSGAALALAGLGRADEARERAAQEVALARAAAGARALGLALGAASAVAAGDDERELLADEAVAVLEPTLLRVELARALLARGALRRRTGRRRLAREDLQRAYELASARGALPLAEAAAAELRSSGARLQAAAEAGADALTPSERRVAELAAVGHSNREIAQSLFVSEKTVEAHLGRTYRKLGIRSRGRLAAALGALGAERTQQP